MKTKDLLHAPRSFVRLWVRDPLGRGQLGRWLGSLREGHTPLVDGLPWLTLGAIDWLEQTVQPGLRAFEWGSGGSTLFLARRGARVIAVEHDPGWYESVVAALAAAGCSEATCRLIEPVPEGAAGPGYRSRLRRYQDLSFRPYAEAIDAFPPGSFDLVSIDGRARVACAEHALRPLAPGGWLLLDNSERPEYAPIHERFHALERLDFAGVGPYSVRPWRTTVWRAPP